MVPKSASHLFTMVLVILVGTILPGRGHSRGTAAHAETQPLAPQMVSAPTGAQRCVFCHQSEVEQYSGFSMAHSLRRAGHEPNGTVTTAGAKITMYSSPTGYWQRLESGGEVTNYRIDYVIGSGKHASGYLLDLAGHLFQSPVAYYQRRHAYDLAPGYEGESNPDFTRPISEGCLFCHSGSSLPVPNTQNQYRPAVFSAEAITCERCHGPAEKHLKNPKAGNIINPSKLEPVARDSICEQCHLLGVARVLNPGKKFSDFRPGERLTDVFATYVYALPPGATAGKFKVISHVEQLAKSTCARMSHGRLWCGTCHNPHEKPVDPVRYYRSKCLTCHTGDFPPSHPSKESNCIGCHMPRRNAKDGGHTAFTDHRIQARPQHQPDLPADIDIAAWRQPAPDLQKRDLGVAYIDAGMQQGSPRFLVHGYRLLTEVQNQFPTDPDVFSSIGNALLLAKHTSEAELAFERTLQLAPNSAPAETNAAAAYLQAGDVAQAVEHLQHAVALDPLSLAAAVPLINLYRREGKLEKAADLSATVQAALKTETVPGEATRASVSKAPQTAEQAFKNIRVLKSIASDQLIPTMRFISASLGVECSYCHVEGHFERDDKKPKAIARKMMRMMLAIDRDSFQGTRQVTCYSCHRGSVKPEAGPIAGGEVAQASVPGGKTLPATLPTADQIVSNYIRALGGIAAIERITSRVEQGTATLAGESGGVEVFDRSPGQEAFVQHRPAGDSITVFNGQDGWFRMPGRPVRNMNSADLDAARMDADLQFPLHFRREFDELRVEYPEWIGGREAYVMSGLRVGQPPVKFYFDEQSGLLVRLVRYAESPLGRDPTQIDYGDFRDADGVEVPFRWTLSQPGESTIIQLEQVQQNVAIPDSEFAKPQSSEAKPSP
jgi:photosynthetic reaction center cytochrome c subunit